MQRRIHIARHSDRRDTFPFDEFLKKTKTLGIRKQYDFYVAQNITILSSDPRMNYYSLNIIDI